MKYQKAIDINPKFAEPYQYWGAVLVKQRDYKGALAKYQKVIELDPNDLGKQAQKIVVLISRMNHPAASSGVSE